MATNSAPAKGSVTHENHVQLVGTVHRYPEIYETESGDIARFELRIALDNLPGETVPVAWAHPDDWVTDLEIGEEVAVRGRVRQRFFRSGGTTQSRTEVVVAELARCADAPMLRRFRKRSA